jgi:hypothetical protein
VAEVPEAPTTKNCLACHTNEMILQALAEEKEVKSEKTSGEG